MSKITALVTVPLLAADTQDWRVAVAALLIGAAVELFKFFANRKKSVHNEKKNN